MAKLAGREPPHQSLSHDRMLALSSEVRELCFRLSSSGTDVVVIAKAVTGLVSGRKLAAIRSAAESGPFEAAGGPSVPASTASAQPDSAPRKSRGGKGSALRRQAKREAARSASASPPEPTGLPSSVPAAAPPAAPPPLSSSSSMPLTIPAQHAALSPPAKSATTQRVVRTALIQRPPATAAAPVPSPAPVKAAKAPVQTAEAVHPAAHAPAKAANAWLASAQPAAVWLASKAGSTVAAAASGKVTSDGLRRLLVEKKVPTGGEA